MGDTKGQTVSTKRFRHTLRWLRAFIARERGTVERIYYVHDEYAENELVIEVDASPWGFGGVLYLHGVAVHCFAEPVSKHDIVRFGIVVGDCRFHALLDTLVLLIAVRTWAGTIGVRKRCVTC